MGREEEEGKQEGRKGKNRGTVREVESIYIQVESREEGSKKNKTIAREDESRSRERKGGR